MNPDDRKYTKEHEWVKLENARTGLALVGITHYAQDQLGDIVYFDLPKPGASLKQLQKMGEVESVKAVSDLFSPVTGQVVETNPELGSHPELANHDPFNAGWLLRVTIAGAGELQKLMSAAEYDAFIGGLH
ncbi:MAG: glycine cleavage system protein GcvH [Dehalococcoidia bacterium]|nr:glycine cleavage system protein GcvH [Dehalococcoidia bacterium]MSQ16441.1 glycine cleavage system protein GcvH [Dehalococcoidia bacterium]